MGITLKITRMGLVATLAGLSAGQGHCWLLDDDTDYGCVVEEARYAHFDGETGNWKNAPKSVKIRIENCGASVQPACQSEQGMGSILTVTPNIFGDGVSRTYWGLFGAFSGAMVGSIRFDQEKLYASNLTTTGDGDRAVFFLSATCFELAK